MIKDSDLKLLKEMATAESLNTQMATAESLNTQIANALVKTHSFDLALQLKVSQDLPTFKLEDIHFENEELVVKFFCMMDKRNYIMTIKVEKE